MPRIDQNVVSEAKLLPGWRLRQKIAPQEEAIVGLTLDDVANSNQL
jgi:hypothetical protein